MARKPPREVRCYLFEIAQFSRRGGWWHMNMAERRPVLARLLSAQKAHRRFVPLPKGWYLRRDPDPPPQGMTDSEIAQANEHLERCNRLIVRGADGSLRMVRTI
jgi:hypothetical protein